MKTFLILLALTTPALADPTFTKEEAQAIYTMGVLNAGVQHAQAALDSFAATPVAKSALAKMNTHTESQKIEPKKP